MMQMIGLIRLGRDAELKQTPAGVSVLSFSGVYDMQARGEKVSQWVDFAMFGKRAESLAQYMTKGKQVVVSASAPRIEVFQKRDGTSGVKLVALVDNIEFAGSAQDARRDAQPAGDTPSQDRPQQPARSAQVARSDDSRDDPFGTMDDDIPFN
jgi:single-strand DNA-binding protein